MLTACVGDYEPAIEEDKKIVVELEISPGEDPKALIHLTNSILDPADSFFYPIADEAEPIIVDDPSLLDSSSVGRLAYAQTPGLYISQSTPIEEGVTYYLRVVVPTKEVDTLYASTTVPFADKIEEVTTDSSEFQLIGDTGYGKLEFSIELPEPQDPTSYFHLIPAIKNGEQAAMGIVQYDELSRKDLEILTDQNAIKTFIHKNGIFIDNSKLESNTVGLKLFYKVNEQFVDDVDSISFTLRTINRESMVYHDNTDRELRTSTLPLDEPQISANNIENGYGLFGAYSSDTVIVPIE